ncbi:MAG: hypothetical protein FJX97_06805 [Bacteroidetes bacterium]|nr:hypothetical protein [Bacteroidota bacterium]
MLQKAAVLSIYLGSLFLSWLSENSEKVNWDSKAKDLSVAAVELNKSTGMASSIASDQDARTLLLDSIFSYICASKMMHKEIVIKQVIWETGWLKGEFLMSRNNLFGFKNKEYLRFSSWQESLEYYEQWQAKYYLNHKEDYYRFLVRMKYSNSRYPAHLKSIKFSKTCDNS